MSRRSPWVLAGLALLTAAVAIAYANCLRAPFLFDDYESILTNYSIRHLADWKAVLSPPGGGITVSGRPLLNLSFALNWAWTGDSTWSYHLVNLAGHCVAAFLLFGLLHRTFARWPAACPCPMGASLAVALLWAVHPLQTETVTYTVQRAELMMAICYLAVLYGVARDWPWMALGACAVGMFCKEVMVSAPVLALAYDAIFLSGTLAGAWRRRRWLWLALAATWVPLGWEVVSTGNRGGTAGFGSGVAPWAYWWTQGPAIARYLRLTFWPHPLVLDYGFERRWIAQPWTALPANLFCLALAAGAIVLLIRQPRWGFLGLWFFAILAPTSLVPGNRQTLAEHRMYLAEAPLLTLVGLLLLRIASTGPWIRRWAIATGTVAAVFVVSVRARNAAYDDPESLWRQNVREMPDNPWAYTNLGSLLYAEHRLEPAVEAFRKAVELAPNYGAGESNLGVVLQASGRFDEAILHFQRAFAIKPDAWQIANNIGVAMAGAGRWTEAVGWYRRAIGNNPHYPAAEANLGIAFGHLGDYRSAESWFRRSLADEPNVASTHYQFGLTLRLAGHPDQAEQEYRRALELSRDDPVVEANLAVALSAEGRGPEALEAYDRSLKHDPTNPETYFNRGLTLAGMGRRREAIADYREAVRLRPGYAEARADWGVALLDSGDAPGAWQALREAARLAPDRSQIHYNLGLAAHSLGRHEEAVAAYRRALALDPDLAPAAGNLAVELAQNGRLAEAVEVLRAFAAGHPGSATAHEYLARAYTSAGRRAEAAVEFAAAARLRRQ